MKQREYISPTSVKAFNDVDAFYNRYLSDIALDREPQTRPMSIGSSFDAYTKSYLHEQLFGKGHDPRFEFQAIFETQVEPHNRDWALVHGKRAFDNYKAAGALNDLYLDLAQAQSTPRFEFEVQGHIKREVGDKGVVLLGKPDLYYKNKYNHPVILDWKVNGWCSNFAVSPYPGYVRLRHCDGTQPRSIAHKDAVLVTWNGVTINKAKYLEDINEDWAGQLCAYGWLLGEPVGGEFLTCIDQLVCKPTGGFPEVRIAEHRTTVSVKFQQEYYEKASHVWDVIHSDHIFRQLSKEESAQRCKALDMYSESMSGPQTDEDRMFRELNQTKRGWQ